MYIETDWINPRRLVGFTLLPYKMPAISLACSYHELQKYYFLLALAKNVVKEFTRFFWLIVFRHIKLVEKSYRIGDLASLNHGSR